MAGRLAGTIASGTRRICAGDWVRLVGQAASVRGLGKVLEGAYDPADNALLRAHVEFARGALWLCPAELRRIDADEEMRLCEEAIETVLMPEPAVERIRTALRDPERLKFIRSPGFLDLLWGLLGSLPNERAVNGLARFFDEGGAPRKPVVPVESDPTLLPTAWQLLRVPGPAPRTAAPGEVEAYDPIDSPAAAGPPPSSIASNAIAPLPSATPPWRSRYVAKGTAKERVLGALNHNALLPIAEKAGLRHDRRPSIRELRRDLLGAGVDLLTILVSLTENQRRMVAETLGVPCDDPGKIEARILQLAIDEPRPEP